MPRSFFNSSIASANNAPSMSSTVLPNIAIRRRYESRANRASPEISVSPCTEASFNPTLRTVSIIPGIENFAPDRTDTSSGSSGSPNCRPIWSSNARNARVTCTRNSGGTAPSTRYRRHASVVTVNPGGTGNPNRVISARFAPLPPNRSFSSLPPSVNSNTYFGMDSASYQRPVAGARVPRMNKGVDPDPARRRIAAAPDPAICVQRGARENNCLSVGVSPAGR